MIPRTSWTNVTPLFNCAKMASDFTSDFHGCFVRCLWMLCAMSVDAWMTAPRCANLRIAYVPYMSQVTFGIRGIVFWAPADSSYRSPPNDLWETAGYWVREIVFESPQIAVQSPSNVSWQSFSGTFLRYVRRFRGYPAMLPRIICDDSADGSWKSTSRAEIRGKPTRVTFKQYNLSCFWPFNWNISV